MPVAAHRVKRFARLSLAAWCILAASGCSRWVYANPRPAPGDAPATFSAARVTAVDGVTTQVLRDVEVTADSVIGWHGPHRFAYPRSAVLVLDRREFDALRTAGASVLGVLLAYGAVVVYFLSHVKV